MKINKFDQLMVIDLEKVFPGQKIAERKAQQKINKDHSEKVHTFSKNDLKALLASLGK